MNIRKSNTADIETMMELATAAKKIMRANGNMTQWSDGYPSAEVFANDISNGYSYMIEQDGKAVATFAFIPSPEPTYAQIYEGQWDDDQSPYHVVHRIASLPECHGVMKALLDFCFEQCDNIRIDTHRDNAIMRHLMKRHGFNYCGIIYLANGDERLAYQKIVKKR